MADQITLNNKEIKFTQNDLLGLILYQPKVGGSHFTMTVVANLLLRGSKILMLSAYPMARDNIIQQLKDSNIKTDYIININQVNANAQAIILESGNESLFLKTIEGLKDIKERVVLIKNFEVFSFKIVEACLNLDKVILSGDIEKSQEKDLILAKQYKTYVVFSNPSVKLPFITPVLEKYSGYLYSNERQGLVRVLMKA